MTEFIDREALREAVKKYAVETKYDWTDAVDLDEFEKILDNMPKADVVPVRRGKWIYSEDDYESHINCSECGYEADYENFCPNCGAYMGGADNG